MINIGILGLGTVASAVVDLFQRNIDVNLAAIKIILVNDIAKNRDVNLTDISLTTDPADIINNPAIDLVIELMGGHNPALDYILIALKNKKPVVTANKEVLALYGDKVFKAALDNNTPIAFEASVGGGIPIIRSLISSFNANSINKFIGICNGTSNYILSKMFKEHISFADALEQAKALGFAELDPSTDIDGHDSAHKCSILATLAFKHHIANSLKKSSFNKIYCEGIADITLLDLQHADRLGYSIKPIVYGSKEHSNIQLATFPALIIKTNLVANIHGVENIIQLDSSILNLTNYTGLGAGGQATAASILSDLWNIIQNPKLDLNFYSSLINKYTFKSIEEAEFSYFITLSLCGKIACKNALITKVIAEATTAKIIIKESFFSDHDHNAKNAYIVLLTDVTISLNMQNFFTALLQLENIVECKKIRVID